MLFLFFPKPYEGLRPQDLRRLKDMLIVETADMLQAPLFTAEALLRAHGNEKCLLILITQCLLKLQSLTRLFLSLNMKKFLNELT